MQHNKQLWIKNLKIATVYPCNFTYCVSFDNFAKRYKYKKDINQVAHT